MFTQKCFPEAKRLNKFFMAFPRSVRWLEMVYMKGDKCFCLNRCGQVLTKTGNIMFHAQDRENLICLLNLVKQVKLRFYKCLQQYK